MCRIFLLRWKHNLPSLIEAGKYGKMMVPKRMGNLYKLKKIKFAAIK